MTAHDWATEHLAEIDQTDLHGLYIADHPSFATTDSWSWLAYAAGQTKRIRLGTHVTGASFHHPTRLAKQVVTVDVLSGGRATLGIGTGYEVHDYRPYGFEMPDFKGRVQYMEESLTVIKAMFAGQTPSYKAVYLSYEGGGEFAPVPVQKGGIPIVIGLNRAGLALRVAGRHADAINTWQLSPVQIADIKQPLAEACDDAGRSVKDVAITCDVLMAQGANEDAAEELAGQIRDMARGWGRDESVTDWHAGGVLHGDGDNMCAQLAEFADVGATEVTVAVSSMDDITWLQENIVSRF